MFFFWPIFLHQAFFFVEPGETRSYLTDHERKYHVHNDSRIIEFSDPFVFRLTIFLCDNEIQPALFPAPGFYPVNEMDDGAQENKAEDENDGFRQPEQEVISPQKAQQKEDLGDFEPLRLQCVRLNEMEVVFDLVNNFVHLTLL